MQWKNYEVNNYVESLETAEVWLVFFLERAIEFMKSYDCPFNFPPTVANDLYEVWSRLRMRWFAVAQTCRNMRS